MRGLTVALCVQREEPDKRRLRSSSTVTMKPVSSLQGNHIALIQDQVSKKSHPLRITSWLSIDFIRRHQVLKETQNKHSLSIMSFLIISWVTVKKKNLHWITDADDSMLKSRAENRCVTPAKQNNDKNMFWYYWQIKDWQKCIMMN